MKNENDVTMERSDIEIKISEVTTNIFMGLHGQNIHDIIGIGALGNSLRLIAKDSSYYRMLVRDLLTSLISDIDDMDMADSEVEGIN